MQPHTAGNPSCKPFLLTLLSLVVLQNTGAAAEPIIWRLENAGKIGNQETTVLGNPVASSDGLTFDGAHDGVFVPVIPIAGWSSFTIEILFSPSDSGHAEQRFLHLEDERGARGLIELRLNQNGEWWLDTFLRDGDSQRALIDSGKKHPAGQWYWAALRYDGTTMTHFVNGEQEIQGAVSFHPMGAGRVSIGVRQNKVFWYKGSIREVRFTPTALPREQLQRPQ
ncbi:MAG: LamG domain-containing protein [Opitutus sp.]